MKYTIHTRFEIGDTVFHRTSDSPKGLILDISYLVRSNTLQYKIVWGIGESEWSWCYEDEISESQIFN